MNNLKPYLLTVIGLIFILSLNSCQNFTNQSLYKIKVGESFDLYLSENSCCVNCFVNKADLKSIELVDRKLVDSADADCAGCNSEYAWVFKGINVGVDTIKIQHIPANKQCSDSIQSPDFFIVIVTQ